MADWYLPVHIRDEVPATQKALQGSIGPIDQLAWDALAVRPLVLLLF